jgi:hypothetical protein
VDTEVLTAAAPQRELVTETPAKRKVKPCSPVAKLSRLQRWILAEALRRRPPKEFSEWEKAKAIENAESSKEFFAELSAKGIDIKPQPPSFIHLPFLYRVEILSGYFGMVASKWNKIERRFVDTLDYKSVQAALSRALRRLRARGLMTKGFQGEAQLTLAGLKVAKELPGRSLSKVTVKK